MSKGCIYYTDNKIKDPIKSHVYSFIKDSGLPIVSCSLKPIEFGDNIVLNLRSGVKTMWTQILTALEKSTTDYVFFCEHDVLYPKSHFDFTPPKEDVFYYNSNVYRWDYPNNRAITYDRLISLSGLCCNRQLAVDHYRERLEIVEKKGWDQDKSKEPWWGRRIGYEPGTKPKKRGGYFDENFDTWKSRYPIVDIRYNGTFSPRKVTLKSFRHLPTNWEETTLDQIPGWNLKELWNLAY